MEKEHRPNQEDESKPHPPEETTEGGPEAEKSPDDTEMWSAANGLDTKAREVLKREGRAFHESVADVAFGDPADFAAGIAGAATIEMQPFLEAFQQATKNAPETGKITKARETIQQSLDQHGAVGTTLDKKG